MPPMPPDAMLVAVAVVPEAEAVVPLEPVPAAPLQTVALPPPPLRVVAVATAGAATAGGAGGRCRRTSGNAGGRVHGPTGATRRRRLPR